MRYLVFGDIHGNLAALDSVLDAGHARGIDGYFCLGDIIGYGPNPLECVDRLYALKLRGLLAWVAGNHELALRGEADLSGYSAEAVATLQWTRKVLGAQPWAMHFIRQGELCVHVNNDVYLTHDSMADPSSGRYHRTALNAVTELKSLVARRGRLAFYGHTHSLRAEMLQNGSCVLVPIEAHEGEGKDPHPLRLEPGQVGWIGVGSVGFPTNRQRMPEYLIFDDSDWHVEKYAVSYPRDAAKAHARQTLTPVCGQEVAERIARWL